MVDIRKYLWLSQVFLFGALLVCCLIEPSVMIKNGGFSNFGNYAPTVVSYILGFALNIVFISLAARTLLKIDRSLLKAASLLFILAFLTLLVFLSTFPRHISWTYSDIHDYLGIALFAYEFILSVWFVIKQKSRTAIYLLLTKSVGSIIGLLSILKVIHFLFIGQIIGTVGFSLLLVTCLPRIIEADIVSGEKS